MTTFFEWDQTKFGLGVAEMDREHQLIVSHMNRLHDQYVAKAPYAELSRTMNALADTTVKHFAGEEAYMARIGFPGLAGHQMIHRTLIEKVLTHKREFERTQRLADDFFAFLKMWLKAHICGIDVKYSVHRLAA